MEILIYLIPTLVALGAASSGWMRIAARSYLPPAISLIVLCAAAAGCWLIAATKTGSYLAGLVGTLLAMLLAVGAAGLVAGMILRLAHERMHLRIKRTPAAGRAAPPRAWDTMALAALSAIALGFSVME